MQDVERFLYRYRTIKQQIKERELQVDELVAKKDAIADRLLRAPRLDNVRVQGGISSDPVCDAVCKMVDVYGKRISRVVDEINALYVQLDDINRRVDAAELTEQEREYVRLRYFEGLSAARVADSMGYCEREIRRVKKKLFEKLKTKCCNKNI